MHPPEEFKAPLRLCDLCGKSVSNLDAHLWGHNTPEEKEQVVQSGRGFAILPCDRCGKEFTGFDKFAAHQTIRNRCKGTGHPVEFTSPNPGSARKIACATCGKPVFYTNLPQHEWTHKNRIEKAESARLGKAPIPRCHVCDKLVTRSALKSHLQSHGNIPEVERKLKYLRNVDHEGVPLSPSGKDDGLLQCPGKIFLNGEQQFSL
ncbi:Zinc finger and BTB domain-containing protein 49 [Folsomia candida]|uniref:Zinc finger and BTB domain-containing protein 49 n=1 Tax=Folsomia candida TaxID=158441 RepID=A0A226DB75_FOLCA|nr:Zinc finger and BTB domain-containing protein 49 [Folsomia candida]